MNDTSLKTDIEICMKFKKLELSYVYLFNGVFFASDLSYFSNNLNVIL